MEISPEAMMKKNLRAIKSIVSSYSLPINQWNLPVPTLIHDPATKAIVNFRYGAGIFYPVDAKSFAAAQVEAFSNEPLNFAPPVTVFTKDDAIPFSFANLLDQETQTTCMMRPDVHMGKLTHFNAPKYYVPRIGIFGIGLAHHIDQILSQFTIYSMLIVETDPVVMAAGLASRDWSLIIAKAKAKQVNLKIVFHPEPTLCAYSALNQMRQGSMAGHIGVRYYAHHIVGNMEIVKKTYSDVMSLAATPGGYFNDEFRQAKQTRDNLKELVPVICRKSEKLPADKFAVVVGSGPSLDRSLDLLKSIRDQVTIFACGSALRPLTANGIRPDFHVELETHVSNIPIVQAGANAEILENVPILCSSGTPKGLWSLFRRTYLFARAKSTSSYLFGDNVDVVDHAFARVGNAGLALAIHLGFVNVVMLGMDTGYSKDEADHAKNSIYETAKSAIDDSIDSIYEGTEQLAPDVRDALRNVRRSAVYPIPGITGDTLMVDSLFALSLSSIIDVARENPDRKIYQVGYGVRIDYGINMTVEDFQRALPKMGTGLSADQVIEHGSISDAIYPAYADMMNGVAIAAEELYQQIVKISGRKVTSLIEYVRRDDDLTEVLNAYIAKSGKNMRYIATASGMLSGSIGSMARAVMERALMFEDGSQAVPYLQAGITIVRRMAEEMKNNIVKDFRRQD